MTTPLLEIKNLHARVEDKEIIKGLDLTVNAGEVHAIMGPNGAGKSSLSNVLAGKDGYEVTDGSIMFKGQNLLQMSTEERARSGLFLSMQYPIEIPGVMVSNFLKQSLNSVLKHRGEPELDTIGFMKLLKTKAAALGINPEMLKRFVNVGFSGGEKKKAEILQMLMLEPSLAILDETDSGLDVDAVRTVSEGVRLYRDRVHGSLLIITHSTRILEALDVDAAHVMENGVIVKNGSAELVEQINEKGFSSLSDEKQ